ncbi:MAG: type VI secretion system tube protein Hcp [Rhodocyclaceae bacterium]|nr:type VI secretion system tube protein Hcp [Rhodocyclaceae bacterium]
MATDTFIKIGDVKGEAQDDKHKDEIDVLSWSWGATQSGYAHLGGGAGAGKVNIQDLTFTHYLDRSTPVLLQACADGTHFKDAKLVVRKAGGKEAIEYVTITMEEVFITSVQSGGHGAEDRLTETVSLNFGLVKLDYQPQKRDGSKEGGMIKFAWDIEKNKKP